MIKQIFKSISMKAYQVIFVLLALAANACTPRGEIMLQISNPSDLQRDDATLLIPRTEMASWMDITGENLPLLFDEKDTPLSCQADDVDGDGVWDELFALIDLSPKEQKKVILRFVDPADYPEFETRTNLRLGDASKAGYPNLSRGNRLEGISYHNYSGNTDSNFQMEGLAWENDHVGFRNYMDQRNGMDIFGKLTHEMVLDSVGIKNKESYHNEAEWGMDILKVGTSLGAGAIGYMYNDSIYRVGDNGSGDCQIVFEGSQRSRFKLSFSNWKVDGSATELVHQLDISAGKHYYQSQVTYSGNDLEMNLVAGIVNMKSKELHVLKPGENHTALLTHDLQAEDNSMLAMALLIPNEYLVKYGETRESGEGIIQSYYAALDAAPGKPVPYRFYALWEKEDPRWASLEEISKFMEEEAALWTQPVNYQISK
jgi:Domain of unknown function (DUF4861)